MKRAATILFLCVGLGAPMLGHTIEWNPVYSGNNSSPHEATHQDHERPSQRYESNSGTQYQYDLSDPVERNRYNLDLDAQRRDMQSADPRRDIDRSSGQSGGGIYR